MIIEPDFFTHWKTNLLIGLTDGMEQLKAIGNGQVPIVAANAFTILHERICIVNGWRLDKA